MGTVPTTATGTVATPTPHTGHCCCCNLHNRHCNYSDIDSENKSRDDKPMSASVAPIKRVTKNNTHSADDNQGPSSIQWGEEEVNVQSFYQSDLRDTQKDFGHCEGENIVT